MHNLPEEFCFFSADSSLSENFSDGKIFIALELPSGDLIISFTSHSCNFFTFSKTSFLAAFFVFVGTFGLSLKKFKLKYNQYNNSNPIIKKKPTNFFIYNHIYYCTYGIY